MPRNQPSPHAGGLSLVALTLAIYEGDDLLEFVLKDHLKLSSRCQLTLADFGHCNGPLSKLVMPPAEILDEEKGESLPAAGLRPIDQQDSQDTSFPDKPFPATTFSTDTTLSMSR
jgi:hypothetical protein